MSTILPVKNEEYGTKDYWDQRYTEEQNNDSFDWFKSYADLAHLLRELIPNKSSRILMLGCGNSRLSEDMWEDGYCNIVNVDYSGVLIEQMKKRHSTIRPEMEWHEMDVRNLIFEDGSFDVAIDKGTMDAMMTAKGDVWDPPQQVIEDCNKEVDETLRVLNNSGVFIYLTFGQPHFRRRYLQREGTYLSIKELGEAFHYYLYILRKNNLP
ncbi:EEF1A lysine methyltransferase 4 [Psilocybe cubensis]|uniref:EEF1A lysine methyltransferase 4 n=1 Tax=Psilocybe cubensis TaxID=181762 RepID=A0ACB8GX04_PSICU|nr:EEF1A lysine methyltransferase 4 [Psilocybe cubensis]KAH9479539.1 EEF1A lysine methyltransferase 4 [Psilocybe cubensis]